MSFVAAFVPRDPAFAKRALVVLTGVATSVTIVFSVVGRPEPPLGLIGSVVALLGVAMFGALPAPPEWSWLIAPVAATGLLAGLDLGTSDGSVSAQMYFVFPALYAGSQLPRLGARLLCGLAVVLAAVVNLVLLPTGEALVNAFAVSAVLVATTQCLLLSAERVATLVEQLHGLAAVDSLTGLVTRRVLDEAATASMVSAASGSGTALLLIDVDHFKAVNDRYGHPAGDLVLQQVAATLTACTRRSDTVSRMGGDELAVLVAGCSLADAVRLAETVLDRVRGLTFELVPFAEDQMPELASVTASIGVAHLPTHASEIHALYRAADVALYRAKHAGRNQVAMVASQTGESLAS